jgi:hypothetical protein
MSSYWPPPPKTEEAGEAHPPSGADLRHMRRRGPSFAVLTDAAGANRRPKRPEFFNKTGRGRSIAERGDTWRLGHPIEVQTDPGIEPQRREKGSLVVEGVHHAA